jgi:formamidase
MHNRWHPDLEPTARVASGEALRLECEDGAAGQITRMSSHDDVARMDLGLPHPLAGPVYVEGARPGDVLEVEFLSYETPDFGFTPILPGLSFLGDEFPDAYLVKWELAESFARSDELPGVAVPADPFAGVVGVAPSHELMAELRAREERIRAAGGPVADDAPESARPPSAATGLRTIPPREIGGNIDIRGLVAGSKLWLPVHVEGALFSIGDLHFAQGDGEVCGWAIEIAGAVTVRLWVRKDMSGVRAQTCRFPAYETPPRSERAYFATTGLPVDDAMNLTAAARAALLDMIEWLCATRGFSREAAYALCSCCVDLRLSQVVDVPYPLVSALLPLDVFVD